MRALMMVFADLIFLVNVQEHATLSAEASLETGVKVHTAGDVADKALEAISKPTCTRKRDASDSAHGFDRGSMGCS